MKKTLTINLSGIVFNIDENAFETLKNYLDTIKGYFNTSEGRDEIMTDIESRIAEMLNERISISKEVINDNDISEIISIMGQPEDYISDDMEDEPIKNTQSNTQQNKSTVKKKLFRDTESNIIGGVCSGVGHYFGLDPVWFRLAITLSVLFAGTGFLFYLILWIIIPQARTSADKLAMKGEPITFDNIGKTVEDEINNVKKNLSNLDVSQAKHYSNLIQSAIKKVVDFILSIAKFALKAISKVFGFFFLVFGVILLSMLLLGTFSPLNNITFNGYGYNLMEFSQILFPSGTDFWFTVIGLVLLLGIPFLALILAGLILLFGSKLPKYTGLTLASIWIIGLILSAIGGLRTGVQFNKESSIAEVISMNEIASDTVYFEILDKAGIINKDKKNSGYNMFFQYKNEQLILDDVDVNILETKDNFIELEIVKEAHGLNFENADQSAAAIVYNTSIDSNVILIDPYFHLEKTTKWRKQNIKVNLYLPKGHSVFIPSNFKYLLDDVQNYHGTYDRDMVDMYWTMTDSGLVSPQIIKQEQLTSSYLED